MITVRCRTSCALWRHRRAGRGPALRSHPARGGGAGGEPGGEGANRGGRAAPRYRDARNACYARPWSSRGAGRGETRPGSLGKRRKIAARKVPPSEKLSGACRRRTIVRAFRRVIRDEQDPRHRPGHDEQLRGHRGGHGARGAANREGQPHHCIDRRLLRGG